MRKKETETANHFMGMSLKMEDIMPTRIYLLIFPLAFLDNHTTFSTWKYTSWNTFSKQSRKGLRLQTNICNLIFYLSVCVPSLHVEQRTAA